MNLCILSLRIVFILVNRADHGEMWLSVEFHLGVYCLPKYLFTGIQSGNRVKVGTLSYQSSSNRDFTVR